MADSAKKKRKKAAKSRPVEDKAKLNTATPVSNTESDKDADLKVTSTYVPDEIIDDQGQDLLEEEIEVVPVGPELVESTAPSPYDNLVTHRTSSIPSEQKLSTKSKAVIKAARTRKPWLWLAGILLVVLFGLTVWWQWQRSYVGVVNGQYIPTSELYAYTLINGGAQALPQLTQQHLIAQEAYHQNVNVSDEVIQAELQKIVDESGGAAAYQEALEQYGIPESHLVQQIRTKQILVELTKDRISVTDQEVQDYYNNNKETLDPDGTRGFDNIKDLIKIQLVEQKQEAEFATFVQSLTEKSTISSNLDHANLSFWTFLRNEVLSIPGDIANLFGS